MFPSKVQLGQSCKNVGKYFFLIERSVSECISKPFWQNVGLIMLKLVICCGQEVNRIYPLHLKQLDDVSLQVDFCVSYIKD